MSHLSQYLREVREYAKQIIRVKVFWGNKMAQNEDLEIEA
jgi:hypothetical protein